MRVVEMCCFAKKIQIVQFYKTSVFQLVSMLYLTYAQIKHQLKLKPKMFKRGNKLGKAKLGPENKTCFESGPFLTKFLDEDLE